MFTHIFIDIYIFIGIYCGLIFCLFGRYLFQLYSTVFIGLVFIADFIYLFIFIELDLIFLLFNTCTIKFIEGKFYF